MPNRSAPRSRFYNRPTTKFVANFVGTLNTFDAVVDDAAAGRVVISGVPVTLPQPLTAAKGSTVALALRPEAIELGSAPGNEVILPAEITEVHFLGSVIRIRAMSAGTRVALDTFNRSDTPPPPVGAQSQISFSARDLIVLGG